MKLKKLLICLVILLAVTLSFGQPHFRSGIFLHHSTGANIWGPNGGTVTVPLEIEKYNTAHGLAGSDALTMAEQWWPSSDNEWATWHDIFDNRDPWNNIRPILDSNPVIMVKSCFPSSSMTGIGSSADTLNPTTKSIENYKWHWRSLVSVMEGRPQNFFVIWTNAPLVAAETNASQAALASSFCRWAKDTLAAGMDPLFGMFPRNVFVFDLFRLLAGSDGILPAHLASGPSDSHPNAAGTAMVAPLLVNQTFDAALAYEVLVSTVDQGVVPPEGFYLEQNYPNPFNPITEVRSQMSEARHVRLVVYDILGREVAVLVDGWRAAGSYQDTFDASDLSSGVYLCRLTAGLPAGQAGSFFQSRTMLLIR